jgi:hypothetical protein
MPRVATFVDHVAWLGKISSADVPKALSELGASVATLPWTQVLVGYAELVKVARRHPECDPNMFMHIFETLRWRALLLIVVAPYNERRQMREVFYYCTRQHVDFVTDTNIVLGYQD